MNTPFCYWLSLSRRTVDLCAALS